MAGLAVAVGAFAGRALNDAGLLGDRDAQPDLGVDELSPGHGQPGGEGGVDPGKPLEQFPEASLDGAH
ncbi:hypothetical protein [Meiothermus sp.]|uniref:hypothetical protein n=1 Tax=Meiothermus sp. TaxID=1955249 RepID=UPI0011B5D4AE